MKAFSAYGFPESHAQSFASLVYYSAWFKCHYPAIYCAALLRSQPMGFYSPQSLVQDAQRHGVRVHPVDIHHSDVEATCEQHGEELRLGLTSVRGFGKDPASRLVTARQEDGPFSSIADLVLRAGLTTEQVESLALAGALDCLTQQQGGAGRHEALWRAGVESTNTPCLLTRHYRHHRTASTRNECMGNCHGGLCQYRHLHLPHSIPAEKPHGAGSDLCAGSICATQWAASRALPEWSPTANAPLQQGE